MAAKKKTDDLGEGKPRLDGRSALKTAALAVLLERPGHGYDVAQRIKLRIGPSWQLEAKHIYRVLVSLEKAGLAWSAREGPAGSSWGRLIFHPTEKAQRARQEWLTSPARVTVVREDIQSRLAFSSEEEAPELLRALDQYRTDLLQAIEENAAVHSPVTSWLGRVISFTRSGVDRRLNAEIEWVEEVHRELEGIVDERSRG